MLLPGLTESSSGQRQKAFRDLNIPIFYCGLHSKNGPIPWFPFVLLGTYLFVVLGRSECVALRIGTMAWLPVPDVLQGKSLVVMFVHKAFSIQADLKSMTHSL